MCKDRKGLKLLWQVTSLEVQDINKTIKFIENQMKSHA